MVQPINYMLDVQNPIQTAMTGLTQGMQIGQFMQAKEQAEREAIQKQQMQEELLAFASKPNKTHDDYANIMARFPSLAEDFKRSYDVLDTGRQQASFKTASRAYSAAAGGRADIAKSILENEALGYENAGDKATADQMRNLAKMADQNPDGFLTSTGLFLASANPDKFKDTLGALGENQKLPEEINLTKAQTEKTKAETGDIPLAAQDRRTGVENQARRNELENQFNYDKLLQENQQFYDNLTNTQKVEAQKLRALKNETTTQKTARLEKAQSFVSTAQNAAGTAKLAAELVNDYKKLADASGAGVWNAAMRNIPGTAEYDFSKRVDTLKSQAFLIGAQNLKGLGAMTEMEGKKVTDALGNLDLSQGTKQVAEQLVAIARSANSVAQVANKNAQIYATKGQGYSPDVINAARELGISPAKAQKFVNDNGL